MEAQAPARSRGSLHLIGATARPLAQTGGAHFTDTRWRTVSADPGNSRIPSWVRTSYSRHFFRGVRFGDGQGVTQAQLACSVPFLRRAGVSRRGLWKRGGVNSTNLAASRVSKHLPFRDAAKCNASLHSAVVQCATFNVSYLFQKRGHFLKLCFVRNPPEARSGLHLIYLSGLCASFCTRN